MRSEAVLALEDVQERSAVEVRERNGFKGVFATANIRRDSVIFRLKGTVSNKPTKYTIQVGHHRHLSYPNIRQSNDNLDYCWQYLNHSCEPNGYVNSSELTFRALRNIGPGEEITFNYLTTESEMAMPFDCTCGSPNCFGFIKGRNFLTQEQFERLALAVGADNVVTRFESAVPKISR
jgi:hypothetical protein